MHLMKLLSGIAVLGFAASAPGLTIVPTFDTSITSDPNAAAMEAAINAAINALQTNIADNFTVSINFVSDTNVDLGQSDTYGGPYPYASYLAALKSSATDANDTNACRQLPDSPNDPLIGGAQIHLTLPLARLLGLDSGFGPNGFDSTISLNTSIMNFTRPETNSTNYDMQSVVAHEMDEVLGTSSGLPASSPVWAMDLFRYTTNLVRTFTTNGDNAYFSVDGTNLWARFNQDPDGDYGDWWSQSDIYWAPPGHTPVAQVQDAFGEAGIIVDLGTNELAMLDAIGWTLSSSTLPTAPTLTMIPTGPGQYTFAWQASLTDYVLQETTNLAVPGSWVESDSGYADPALIVSADAQKFYRLHYQHPVSSVVPAQAAAVQLSTNAELQLVTRVYQPRKP
jgi:hypothetical protein